MILSIVSIEPTEAIRRLGWDVFSDNYTEQVGLADRIETY